MDGLKTRPTRILECIGADDRLQCVNLEFCDVFREPTFDATPVLVGPRAPRSWLHLRPRLIFDGVSAT
jgi:hypothetical protein